MYIKIVEKGGSTYYILYVFNKERGVWISRFLKENQANAFINTGVKVIK